MMEETSSDIKRLTVTTSDGELLVDIENNHAIIKNDVIVYVDNEKLS